MIAINKIRHEPNYRRGAFDAGLDRLGYKMVQAGKPKSRDDLLCIWNRQGADEAQAGEWEAMGGTVVIAENGYLGRDDQARQLYAISVHGHNGSGWFPVGTEDRFSSLGIELQPWCEGDGHILLCGQRGIGSRQMASPSQWEDRTSQRLKGMGYKDIRVRRHPRKASSKTTLEQDLDGARLCVIWSSACGVKALTMGVPVVYFAPHWVCEGAAGHDIGAPVRDDARRREAMHRMAFGQWTVAEIEASTPFARILEHPHFGSVQW